MEAIIGIIFLLAIINWIFPPPEQKLKRELKKLEEEFQDGLAYRENGSFLWKICKTILKLVFKLLFAIVSIPFRLLASRQRKFPEAEDDVVEIEDDLVEGAIPSEDYMPSNRKASISRIPRKPKKSAFEFVRTFFCFLGIITFSLISIIILGIVWPDIQAYQKRNSSNKAERNVQSQISSAGFSGSAVDFKAAAKLPMQEFEKFVESHKDEFLREEISRKSLLVAIYDERILLGERNGILKKQYGDLKKKEQTPDAKKQIDSIRREGMATEARIAELSRMESHILSRFRAMND